MKSIPIKEARRIAKEYDADVVCIVAWSKDNSEHVTTYGKSLTHCSWAAHLGNLIKLHILKWPAESCQAVPARIKRDTRPAHIPRGPA